MTNAEGLSVVLCARMCVLVWEECERGESWAGEVGCSYVRCGLLREDETRKRATLQVRDIAGSGAGRTCPYRVGWVRANVNGSTSLVGCSSFRGQ